MWLTGSQRGADCFSIPPTLLRPSLLPTRPLHRLRKLPIAAAQPDSSTAQIKRPTSATMLQQMPPHTPPTPLPPAPQRGIGKEPLRRATFWFSSALRLYHQHRAWAQTAPRMVLPRRPTPPALAPPRAVPARHRRATEAAPPPSTSCSPYRSAPLRSAPRARGLRAASRATTRLTASTRRCRCSSNLTSSGGAALPRRSSRQHALRRVLSSIGS